MPLLRLHGSIFVIELAGDYHDLGDLTWLNKESKGTTLNQTDSFHGGYVMQQCSEKSQVFEIVSPETQVLFQKIATIYAHHLFYNHYLI